MIEEVTEHKTILRALYDRHGRDTGAGASAKPGYGPAKIAYILHLDPDGQIVEIQPNLTDDKKPRPRAIPAPLPPKRTAGVASGAYWDKTSYVLGLTAVDPKLSPAKQAKAKARTALEHAAFKARHEALLGNNADPDSVALRAFLRRWKPADYESLNPPADMLDANVAFKLDDLKPGYMHDRQAASTSLDREAAAKGAGEVGLCLVTGEVAPIARLHPSIKGVPGAQSSGSALVSFNLDAFNSYGRTQGFNAPVSVRVAEAYTGMLNALLAAHAGRDDRNRPKWTNRIGLADDTVVFWAEADFAEHFTREALSPTPVSQASRTDQTETVRVRDVMHKIEAGETIESVVPKVDVRTRVYILGLAPNAARLSVRFWLDQSLGDLARNFKHHWDDMRLEPSPRKVSAIPVWALIQELAAQRKAENAPDNLVGDIMRAIITGGRYPQSLLSQTIMRIRADQDRTDNAGRTLEKVSGLRVAMLKACLARDYRKGLVSEDVPVSLDADNKNPGYQLGRLFAVFERLQRAALGQRNATVRDRFYASASATPQRVYPLLIRNSKNHSKAIRTKIGPALAEWFENQMSAVADRLSGDFPRTLSLPNQGQFALGYYHQREFYRQKRSDVPAELTEADTVADTEQDDLA